MRFIATFTRLSLAVCLMAPSSFTGSASAQTAGFWKAGPYGGNSENVGGRLRLSPPDENWASAEASSAAAYPIWNADGSTVRLHLLLGPARGAGYEEFVGFLPEGAQGGVQGADDVVGVSIVHSAYKSGLSVGLMRKEASSVDKSIRGDQYGNLASYDPLPGHQVDQAGDDLQVELKVNDSTVTAQVGTRHTETHPIGLTSKHWDSANLVLRCKNVNEGRGFVSVQEIAMESPQALSHFVEPLNLRPIANMGFRDEVKGDEKGGWTDQGENDLRNIAVGMQMIRMIPFDIIDPQSNNEKSCVMLYSKNRTYFPKQPADIEVHRLANSLIFLHSAAWATGKSDAATYSVTYEDGSSARIPIVVGNQIDDWWGMQPVRDPYAGILLKVRNDSSLSGTVGIYGYRWINPFPRKTIRSLTFKSAEGDPVVGILAVSLVKDSIGDIQERSLRAAFSQEAPTDLKRYPPDADKVSDQVRYRAPKQGPYRFSVAGSYSGGGGGTAMLSFPGYAKVLCSVGGISRFPYGLEISFYFWPYTAAEWYTVLGKKGGTYGTIEKWYYKYGDPPHTLSYQTMLADYKAKRLKLDLLFNCNSMFDGHDFVYIKTLPEDKMRTQNPLDEGIFNRAHLDAIVRNNASLVDYVVKHRMQDTVAFWEMDNERWDMPGAEYAETVAAHVKMLKSKIPTAKVIVCLGELGPYSANPDGSRAVVWSRDLLKRLQELDMNGKIDYFAPHLYPYLFDGAEEITQNYLEDYSVRNIRRSLDFMSALVDRYGFKSSKFYVSEWGAQSDSLGDQSRNDLITSMAAALATAKDAMAIFSHPRVQGSTWHQFFGASFVDRNQKLPISKWGEQTMVAIEGKGFVSTPPYQAMQMLTAFGQSGTLIPADWTVPKGVHYLCSHTKSGYNYFVVNSTAMPVALPLKGDVTRTSLFAPTVLATSIGKYGGYGDTPGEIHEILPKTFKDPVVPPYSVNLILVK